MCRPMATYGCRQPSLSFSCFGSCRVTTAERSEFANKHLRKIALVIRGSRNKRNFLLKVCTVYDMK